MQLIQRVTSDPYQQQTLVLDDGTAFTLTINFYPLQYGWFITNLTYQDFILNGMRICNSPNMLFQWQNLIPFGLACFSAANREPSLQEDFVTGASQLFILNQDECIAYNEYIKGGTML